MNTYTSYPWAILYGLYLYILFQVLFFLQFGQINTNVSILDAAIVLVGIASVLLLMYFTQKLERNAGYMYLAFALALAPGYIGALVGGLLGFFGVLVGGILPFAILLAIGYGIIRLVNHRSGAQMPGGTQSVYTSESPDGSNSAQGSL